MNKLMLPLLTLSMATLSLSACGDSTEDALNCGSGQRVEDGGEEYCVFRAAVTETGFKCPGEVPNRTERNGLLICSAEEQLAMERAERIEDRAPADWVIDTPVAFFSAQGKTEVAQGNSFPAADNKVFAYWVVSSGSPDYIYVFGQGTATSTGFTINFESEPPAEALNSYGVGVAIVGGLLPSSTTYAPGKLTDESLFYEAATTQALTDRYAIIYKKAGAEGLGWTSSFPEGYSCGKGVPAADGETFDTFEKVDCAQVILRIDTMFDIVNWT